MDIKIFDRINDDARHIRNSVFTEEQGFQNEYDDIDTLAKHIVIYEDGIALGTCRVFYDEPLGCYHTGRIAVLKNHRGKGLGKILVTEAENVVRTLGGNEVFIGGQVRVSSFYEKLGYIAYGEPYLDEGIPHISFKKQL